MDITRILELAHDAARDKWFNHQLALDKMPGNKIRQHREAESWEELQELEKVIKAWNEKKGE